MKKSSYFYFYPYVFIEVGKKEAALYDTFREEVFEIPFEFAIKYVSGERRVSKLTQGGNLKKLICDFVELKLGFITKQKAAIDFIIPNSYYELFEIYPNVRRLIIQITNKCSLNCDVCKRYCVGCGKESEIYEMPPKNILKFIRNIKKLWKIEEIILTGGNIWEYSFLIELLSLLKKDKLESITSLYFFIDLEKKEFYEKKIELLENNLIGFTLSPFILEEFQIEEKIKILKKLRKKGINVNVRIRFDFRNEKYKSTFHNAKIKYDRVFFNKIGLNLPCERAIIGLDINSYLFAKNFDLCLSETIVINSKGKIVPCLYSKYELGSNAIEVLRKGKLLPFWKSFKKEIEPCNSCAFVAGCIQCRILDFIKTKFQKEGSHGERR